MYFLQRQLTWARSVIGELCDLDSPLVLEHHRSGADVVGALSEPSERHRACGSDLRGSWQWGLRQCDQKDSIIDLLHVGGNMSWPSLVLAQLDTNDPWAA